MIEQKHPSWLVKMQVEGYAQKKKPNTPKTTKQPSPPKYHPTQTRHKTPQTLVAKEEVLLRSVEWMLAVVCLEGSKPVV